MHLPLPDGITLDELLHYRQALTRRRAKRYRKWRAAWYTPDEVRCVRRLTNTDADLHEVELLLGLFAPFPALADLLPASIRLPTY